MWGFTVPILKHTIISLFHHDTSVTRVFTIEDSDNSLGGWRTRTSTVEWEFNPKNRDIFGGQELTSYLFLEGFRPRPGEKFRIRYLPTIFFGSAKVLSFQEIREEETVIIETKLKNLPGREAVASLEESLEQVLQESGAGRIQHSIQPIFDVEDIYSWDNKDTLLVDHLEHSNLFITGKSANAIFDAILPVLFQYPFLWGSKVELRYLERDRDLYGFDAIKIDEKLFDGFHEGSYKDLYDFYETTVE